jgi:hypothetical protein
VTKKVFEAALSQLHLGTERLHKLLCGLGEAVFPSPTGRLRGEERSNLSAHDNPATVILPCLDEDLFQALDEEIMARGRVGVTDGGHRRPLFCADPAL